MRQRHFPLRQRWGAGQHIQQPLRCVLRDQRHRACLSGGKLLAAGNVTVGNKTVAIARLQANGAADGGFALTQTNPPGSFSIVGRAVAEDSTGRIVHGGALDSARAYLKRLNSDGTGRWNVCGVIDRWVRRNYRARHSA